MGETISYKLAPNKFLLFGDSITEYSFNPFPVYTTGPATSPEFCFGGKIVNAYARKLDVVARGFAGYNSEQARHIYPAVLEHEEKGGSKVLVSTIYFGTNDATLGDSPQAVKLSCFEENIRFLVTTALQKDIKVILIGPGLHDAEKWSVRLSEEEVKHGRVRTNANNKIYSDKLAEIAKDLNVPFVSLYDKFTNYKGDWKELLSDGIHYTGKAYQLLWEGISDAIEKNYPELLPENLPRVLPPWRELPPNEQLKSRISSAN